MGKYISIIIVHYHVKNELFDCIQSIIDSKPRTAYEIIVVDNDEKKNIKKDLLKRFPKVTYVPNDNKGYGQGNNVGAKQAKGTHLFFLNPDTIVFKGAVDGLYQFLEKNKKAGVIAPFLLHEDKRPFEQQGVKELTPFRAFFSLSIINKLFPNNPVAKNYFIQWDTISTKEVDVVPGTALMLSKELFISLNGFDEHFFLYFEEFDLCKRVKGKGLKLFITPKAKIIHLWERSTKTRNDINKIFTDSRFYYFKKHFGLFPAIVTNMFLNIGKYSVMFLLIFILAAFLLIYNISTYMAFIPDQAWFFLSAKDMLSGHIPLVGITSSHPWLHQGAFWTYLLAGVLFLGHFNPVWGAYLSIIFSLLTIVMLYKIGTKMFSRRVGIIASLFYAISPYFILVGRTPYHTTPIPLLVLLLLFAMYRWLNGIAYGLPLIILLLTLLFNFETATFMLTPIFILLLIYGVLKKTQWIKDLYKPKLLILSLISWLIIMMPMLLYDVHNGYPQTVKFLLWIGYKFATLFGFPSLHPDAKGESIPSMFQFAGYYMREIFLYHNVIFGWLLMGIISLNTLYLSLKELLIKRDIHQYTLLMLFFNIPFIIYLLEKTNSSAYFVTFFPTIALMFAVLVDMLLYRKILYFSAVGLLILMIFFNIYGIFKSNFLFFNNLTFTQQISQARYIVKESDGQEYNLIGKILLEHKVNDIILPYEYLTWWLGHGPSYSEQPLRFYIIETTNGIKITKSVLKK